MIRWQPPTSNEWLAFAVLTPATALILNYILLGPNAWNTAGAWLLSFPFICIQCCCIWYLQLLLMHALRRRYPNVTDTLVRLSLLVLGMQALTFGGFSLLAWSYQSTSFLGFVLSSPVFLYCFLLALAHTMICAAIWEVDYTFQLWKKSLALKEKIQQASLEYRFNMLNSQVNPHFLFNCFNTLSSLIADDPGRAELFLNELSKVYRYLLRNNRDTLSTLQAELDFIASYQVLLQTRHGQAVQVQTHIDKRYHQYLLPSLTLQLLVENAVKHNTATKSSPLVIDIFTAAGNILVVTNNVQKRNAAHASNGIGLENIRSRLALMQQPGFQILNMAQHFTVVLPLIWRPALEKNKEKQIRKTPKPTPAKQTL